MIQFEAYIPRGLPPGLKPTIVEVPVKRRERSASPAPGPSGNRQATNDPAAGEAHRAPRSSRLLRLLVLPVVLLLAAFLVIVWADSL